MYDYFSKSSTAQYCDKQYRDHTQITRRSNHIAKIKYRTMYEIEEKVLDAEQWRQEAQAIIGDVRDHVRDIVVCDSPALRSSNRAIHLNLTTLEGLEFCIRLSPQGFSIVGNRHDCNDNAKNGGEDDDGEYYETIYSLLNVISPRYRNSFGNSLLDKLQQLRESQS